MTTRAKRTTNVPGDNAAAQDDLHAAALARRQARMAGRVTSPSQAASVPAPSDEVSERAGVVPPAAPARFLSTTYPVSGMTCRTCEVRIERHVGRLEGVEQVSASAVRGRVEIRSTAPLARADVEAALHKAGYELGSAPWLERDRSAWITAGAGVLLIALFAVLANVTGLAGLASGATDIGKGGVMIALLLGLAAGVSTCMALVGGIVLSLSAAHESAQARARDGGAEPGIAARMRPALTFMGGRVIGYAVLGAALGALGASVTLPPQLVAILMIVVAIVMTLVGTRLTGLSPRIAAWSPALPPSLAARLGIHDGGVSAYSDGRAFGLGVASFFMPCGFTQAVQVYALSTGSPMVAGMTMAAFAIGTAPGLLALAGLPVVMPSRARPTLLRLVGVVVVGFALLNLSAGLRLAGLGIPGFGPSAVQATTADTTQGADGTQVLVTQQVADGYTPAVTTVYAGSPVRWTIQSTTTATCAASLVIPDLNVFERLHLGDNTFDLPAMQAGTTLRYSCAMGMYGGEIRVVARPTGATGTAGS